MSLLTISAYQFIRLENLSDLKPQIKQKCAEQALRGTVLLAPEGINCFLAGEPEKIWAMKRYLVEEVGFDRLCYKENPCIENPFKRLLVKIKKEIITFGVPEIRPEISTAPYISPEELKTWLDEGKDFVLLDTRNDYEVEAGTFEKAIHLDISSFKSFPQASQSLPQEVKEKPVVMFCTGGIRCEKASAYFLESGFKEVYQLEGGILKYFEDCKSSYYQGNCFVFDWRLSVDSELKPQPRSANEPVNSGRHRIKDFS